ncbi:GGDEF domain-containing protein [Nguyenibacter sp. L1]|uniref:GGDEF domain-containing protein n=1 Tax=Nguyenibacter sp. L1 TaxID=3049350 RepID=UPI002B48AB00|nr:GGDEF domain-containing protein [Nguyenibacter sp. L1]WRH88481.1 GGDEF domain-containing protein [Nguyenibacter sp. L1]
MKGESASTADAALQHVFAATSPAARQVVHDLVRDHTPALVAAFYAHFTEHAEAGGFLADAATTDRLHASLARWLGELFPAAPPAPTRLVEAQRHIGRFHARAGISVALVSEGVSLIQRALIQALGTRTLDHDLFTDAVIYIVGTLSGAMGLISFTYWRHRERTAAADTAYRLFALNQDLSREGETQKAALMAWSYDVLRTICAARTSDTPRPAGLARSEFGLWVTHKVGLLFDGTAIVPHLTGLIARIDQDRLPAIMRAVTAGDDMSAPLAALHADVTEIMNSLDMLFRSSRNGGDAADPLTRVLNRRFLPSIMSYELRVANQTGRPLAVLFLDVDHFKHVNDTHGHAGGDAVLRAVARVVEESCRPSDMVFRYGGEEFLIVLGDTDGTRMAQTAERLRRQVEATAVTMPDGTTCRMTVSIGAALYSGHPDYEHLLRRADAALYRAKKKGRNRTEIAEAEPLVVA